LIAYGADINLGGVRGESPIYQAIAKNLLNIVDLLLEYGANPNFQDND
jgi:ankyrin repeat protein